MADKAHRLSSLTKEERKIAVAKCYAKSLEIKELETVSLSYLLFQITSENQDSTERLKKFIKLYWVGGVGGCCKLQRYFFKCFHSSYACFTDIVKLHIEIHLFN